jgi:hypothetical protein
MFSTEWRPRHTTEHQDRSTKKKKKSEATSPSESSESLQGDSQRSAESILTSHKAKKACSHSPATTIHTSQAATTSRVPTQTTDFSEAEESIDSDDIMTLYPGKKSAEEERKELAPEPQKCQQ